MGHIHGVYDADIHFSINPVTRAIKNESGLKTILIQGDHNSEVYSFDMPRYIEGHDMAQCDDVTLHYINIDAATRAENKGEYEVQDLQIHKDDPEKVTFSWTIRENATQLVGSLNFLILFKCTTAGTVDYKWHTGINSEISVGKGMDNSGAVVELFPDILAQWKAQIFGDAENAVVNINLAEKNAVASVQAEGAAQVAAIREEGALQVENVRAAAEAIEASRDQIHRNNTLKAAAIIGSAEGKAILLDDSAEQPFCSFQVFGKTEQAKTKGYQLFDASEMTGKTASGVTLINNGDGSFTISGSGEVTGEAFSRTYNNYVLKDLLKPGMLYLNNNGKTVPVFHLYGVDANSERLFTLNTGQSVEITQEILDALERVTIAIYAGAGTTIVPGTIKPILYQDGDGTWEAFTGGKPSPNPEYPQEIKGLENPKIKVCGKNLLENKLPKATNSGITYTKNEDGSITINGTATDDSYYTFGFHNEIPAHETDMIASFEGGNGKIAFVVGYFREDGSLQNSIAYCVDRELHFEFPREAYTTRIYLAIVKGNTFDNLTVYPMIRLADANSDYENHKEQSIQLPYILHGEGDDVDHITIKDGVWGVERYFKKVVYDSNDFVEITWTEYENATFFTLPKPEDCDTYGQYMTSDALCNKFRTDTVHPLDLPENVGNVVTAASAPLLWFGFAKGTTLEEAQSVGEIEYIYKLAEPVFEPFTEAEIEAFRALVSNYPTTTILNDSGAHMAVRYGIDTKTYIQKAIAEALSNNA